MGDPSEHQAPPARHRRGQASRWRPALAVTILAVGTRLVLLDSLPGEWYGDISTVYEYVLDLRDRRRPPGWYLVGIGPLHPMAIRPFLWALGDSYLAIKAAGAVWSLVGIGLVFVIARRLVHEPFAFVAAAVASVGSWWLVYSRLGDVQALTPTLTLLALHTTIRALRRSGEPRWALAAGASSGLGLYLYGNTLVLPLLTGSTLLAAALAAIRRAPAVARVPRPPGARDRAAHDPTRGAQVGGRSSARRRATCRWGRVGGAWLVGLAVVVTPFALEGFRRPDAVSGGHVSARLDVDRSTPGHVLEGYRTALAGYTTTGDLNPRGNPSGATHLHRVSLVLAVAGAAWWLRPSRRRWGAALLGWFVVLHLPYALAVDNAGPSVSRTTAAAPLAYLFVAGGAWGLAGLAVRWWSDLGRAPAAADDASHLASARHGIASATTIVAWVLVGVVAVAELGTYFGPYRRNLPYANTPIARLIVDHARSLPGDPGVHLVGAGWIAGMPETKSVAYALGPERTVVEHAVDGFDCEALAGLPRPALLVWEPSSPLPTPLVEPCRDLLVDSALHVADGDRPTFRSATVGRAPAPDTGEAPPN